MAYPILGTPKPQFFDSNGDPLASGTLDVYDGGTTTPKTYYPTHDDANAGTNGATTQITLDSRGEPSSTQLWGRDGEDYKIVLKDSAGSTIYTLDDIVLPGPTLNSHNVTIGAADATPPISSGDVITWSAGSTAITDFDESYTGKRIYVANLDTDGTRKIVNSSALRLKNDDSADFTMLPGDWLSLQDVGGTWYEISRSVRGPCLIAKIADETVTSSDTLQDDDELAGFQLAPACIYRVKGFLKVNTGASSTPDIKIALQTDQAFMDSYWSLHNINDAGTIVADTGVTTTAITLALVANQVHSIVIDGFIKTHATAIATVDLQWAQGTSDATATTVELGSWLEFEQLRDS